MNGLYPVGLENVALRRLSAGACRNVRALYQQTRRRIQVEPRESRRQPHRRCNDGSTGDTSLCRGTLHPRQTPGFPIPDFESLEFHDGSGVQVMGGILFPLGN